MLDTPEVTDSPAQLTAMIHVTIPRDQIREVMGPGISELMSTVAAQGIAPTGPWFTHHLRMDPNVFDFEICVPVATPVAPAGRVTPGELPAAKVVRTVYRGPYEGLGSAWGEFEAWIKANGHKTRADLGNATLRVRNRVPIPARGAPSSIARWRADARMPSGEARSRLLRKGSAQRW